MVSASTSAAAWAARTTSAWPSGLGAVNPTLRLPSLLTAVPLMTARMRSPSATASVSRLSTTTAVASPGTMPSARASKARTWPSGENGPSGV